VLELNEDTVNGRSVCRATEPVILGLKELIVDGGEL
jgi:hypothetical protein